MLDLPALYLDYTKVRFGCGWQPANCMGEALFFRVFDVVQGLICGATVSWALPQKNILTADPSLAIRGSYLFDNGGNWKATHSSFVRPYFPARHAI